jgi:hypothetical protein
VTNDVGDRPRPLRRGLMDPNNPRQPQHRPAGAMTLTSVQRWVASVLVVSTLLHFSLGLVLAAYYVDKPDSQVGLLVLAGMTGVLSVFAGLAIHQRPLFSPWLVLGWAPSLFGAYLLFWR